MRDDDRVAEAIDELATLMAGGLFAAVVAALLVASLGIAAASADGVAGASAQPHHVTDQTVEQLGD